MKKTAKIFSLLLAILMLAASLALFAACGDSYDEEITVYNWEDYIYSKTELQNDFNEYYKVKTGKTVKVNYSTFDTNETMLTNIINGDAVVDVIAPSEYAIEKLLQHDLLEKIDKTKVSTISNVNSAIYEAVREVFGTFTTDGGETVDITDYFVPYMWGTLGILYNADVVTEADLAKGWGLLWNEKRKRSSQRQNIHEGQHTRLLLRRRHVSQGIQSASRRAQKQIRSGADKHKRRRHAGCRRGAARQAKGRAQRL